MRRTGFRSCHGTGQERNPVLRRITSRPTTKSAYHEERRFMELTMKFAQCFATLGIMLATLPAGPAQEPGKAPGTPAIDYTALSPLIPKIAAAQTPNAIQNNSPSTPSLPLSTPLQPPP